MVLIVNFTLFIVFAFSVFGIQGKLPDENVRFRLNKYNLLWERAQKFLGQSPKLEQLHRELKKLDKLSLSFKHLENKDSEEARNLAIDSKELYLDILNRYSLNTNYVEEKGTNFVKAKFSDKVEQLWQQAMYSENFSPEEMEILEKEFKHHEKKVEEYRTLANQIVDHDSISDNDLRSLDKMSESEMKLLRKDLKMKHHNLTSLFSALQRKVKDKVSDAAEGFTDKRVIELWEHAKQGKFSKVELESIKEELKHFQIRIDKHDHWKDRHSKIGRDVNDGYLVEPNEHETISDKVKEHARLVKKYHATMMDRVQKKEEL